jgi:transcription antitermination factor NusG
MTHNVVESGEALPRAIGLNSYGAPNFTFAPNASDAPLACETRVSPRQCWYAVYTRSRHEKSVAEQCQHRGVVVFLPLYSVQHRWKQRHAELLLPLFPSYLFVQMTLRDRVRVLSVPGVASIVSFNGVPAAVPESQIDLLQRVITLGRVEPHVYLQSGMRVRVTAGPLVGLEGIVVALKGKVQVVVSFDWMCRSIAVSLDAADVQALR